MAEEWRSSHVTYTLFDNDTDTEVRVKCTDEVYILKPKGFVIIRSNVDPTLDPILYYPLQFMTPGMKVMKLKISYSAIDLYQNARLTLCRDLANTYFCRRTPRPSVHDVLQLDIKDIRNLKDLKDLLGDLEDLKEFSIRSFRDTTNSMMKLLRTMEELLNKVTIWHKQCEHLFQNYREATDRVRAEFVALKAFYIIVMLPLKWESLIEFICSKLLCCMLEGEALLLSCTGNVYNKAAFALSSPPPYVPAFSKFALAFRELDWTVNFLCCAHRWSSFDCFLGEGSNGLVYPNHLGDPLGVMENESLEDDLDRQNVDREALRRSLVHVKRNSTPLLFSYKAWKERENPDKLAVIWGKRLQPRSCAPESYSPLDPFVIGDPDISSVTPLPGGSSKMVQKCNWLGETVVLSTMSSIPRSFAEAEASHLARVQHPNVVELMGYAYKEDIRDSKCYLVTEHMEWDLHDLITEKLKSPDGSGTSFRRPPFDFPVAVDIGLQIVEAMIHVHKCRVLHRDLKPKNILASRKFCNSSLQGDKQVPEYYTIKLIDFGSSKLGDQGSCFHTRKQGTVIYMAPEVYGKSEEAYTWSADVYSFGVTCYEIFTGRLPFERGLKFADIQNAMRGEISFPFAHPRILKELIEKCWAQNPIERPSFNDIREVLWRLKSCAWRYQNSTCFSVELWNGLLYNLSIRHSLGNIH